MYTYIYKTTVKDKEVRGHEFEEAGQYMGDVGEKKAKKRCDYILIFKIKNEIKEV